MLDPPKIEWSLLFWVFVLAVCRYSILHEVADELPFVHRRVRRRQQRLDENKELLIPHLPQISLCRSQDVEWHSSICLASLDP